MKKSFTLLLGLSTCLFIFSNFSEKSTSYVFTSMTEGPVLPDIPFEYSDIQFPDHLLEAPEEDPGPTGYESGGIDSTAFDFIEDDIATLGRVLFYDEKLSALENISCGSCHRQELSFAENKALSEGISSLTRRNSLHLNDLAWTNNEGFFWDLSESDLQEMIVLPLTDDNEIGANMSDIQIKLSETDYYPTLFSNAYGSALINQERITEALTHFISSMNTFNSKFDKEASNNFNDFTESELRGLELFGEACTTCHSQGALGSNLGFPTAETEELVLLFPFFFNNGLPIDPIDRGVGEWMSGFNDLFKPPSLRNIELTAPYMHDGSLLDLDEVIDHYSEGVEENEWSGFFIPSGGFGFSEEDKADLKAFLLTLTDDTFAKEEKWSDPFLKTTNTFEIEIKDVFIKPNPMSQSALVEFQNDKGNFASMNIYSTNGQLITHENTIGSSFEIEKGAFNTGMYYIELIIGDQRASMKLIVE